ncbi:uncharacterized protein OCT59_010266 [Rhizophagus irregularis]|uniref:Uncharacterized protein n=2 Tax=Rhizophagus irregularis TaxID=588596 RepID=A0A915ZME5_9GLOM|nr:hypothetical protein RirG_177440 [Rhizophagus irregularis DAOM 197198w]UZO18959.1 hypothetical protein OCT59_010266 [Rhizophagus irregularis]CAB4495224.1 unnamed protein product [Rhizophagus irregularis]CAB5093729.1 unnamed protein product [Rhizophagus irregularis]CAB5382103.1 unnamed protein product [Rhizophagus irregularis]
MNLADLFRGYRHTEPRILLLLKLFMMIILVACLAGYLAIILIDIQQDAPIIRTSFHISDDNLPIRPPSFIFKSEYNFTIAGCIEEHYTQDFKSSMVNCISDMTHPDEKRGPSQAYFGTYQPSKDTFFYTFNKSSDHTLTGSVVIGLIVLDTNYTSASNQALIQIVAFDSGYETPISYISDNKIDEIISNQKDLGTSLGFNDSVAMMNLYNLALNQNYQFEFKRRIKEVIVPSWMNDFGIPSKYETQSYIESTLLPLPNGTSNNMVMMSITPKGAIIQIDREIRTHTYLSGMGLLGGAWGLAAAMYSLLFGADTIRPWGIVQSYCYGFSRLTRRKLKETLPIIPFYDKSYTDANHDLSLDEKIELIPLLQSRIDSLELFLREYVVDVNYLDNIQNRSVSSNQEIQNTTEGPNSLNNQAVQNMSEGPNNLNSQEVQNTSEGPNNLNNQEVQNMNE